MGGKMGGRKKVIDEPMLMEILKLLEEGNLTQVQIGKKFGISAKSVSNISIFGRPNLNEDLCTGYRAKIKNNAKKCPTCGRKVVLPCIACSIEQKKHRGFIPDPSESLAISLEGENLALYNSIRELHYDL